MSDFFSTIDIKKEFRDSLYLDGSYLLREAAGKAAFLTSAVLKAKPQKFYHELFILQRAARSNIPYYQKLLSLHNEGMIKKLISFETMEVSLFKHNNILLLFGNSFELECPICHDYHYEMNNEVPVCKICKTVMRPNTTLWNDELSFKLYNKAANEISYASHIIVDSSFFNIILGISLMSYAKTTSKVIVVGSRLPDCIPSNVTYSFFHTQPHDLISSL